MNTRQNPPVRDTYLLILSAVIGLVAGALHVGAQSLYAATPQEATGQWTLWATPLWTGILAGVCRPHRPSMTAIKLSLVTIACASPLMFPGMLICLILIVPSTLVAAPAIGALVGWLTRRRHHARGGGRGAEWVLLLLPPGGLVLDHFSPPVLPDAELISDSTVVALPRDIVWTSLDELQLDLTLARPWPVGLLTPAPTKIVGGGSEVGSERRVYFENGVLLARVVQSRPPEQFAFQLSVESSGVEFFNHWSIPGDSEFVLTALDATHTRVTHRTRYVPLALPRWYFAPAERWLGHALQRYLLEAYAATLSTPRPRVAQR